jgi:hypothetical protein
MKISIRQLKALIRESVMETEMGMGNASKPMHGGSDEEKERIAAMIQDELEKFLEDPKSRSVKDFQKQLDNNKIVNPFETPFNEARKLRSMIRATIRNTTRR